MMNYKTLHEKYYNDASFHQIVNLLESMIEKLQMTPSEIREAAMFACILHEQRKPQTFIYHENMEKFK